MSDDDELRRVLDRPALARLWQGARAKAERLGRVGGEVRLDGASFEERQALADLLSMPKLPPPDLSVSLFRLDRDLRSSRLETDLLTALELLGGTLRNRPAERRHEQAWRQGTFRAARAMPLVALTPGLEQWLHELERSGLLRRLDPQAKEVDLLIQTFDVLALLLPRPEDPLPRRLAVLAQETLGGSHALDAGRPISTVVLRALAFVKGCPPPKTSAARRELWAWVGVVVDDLSCDVLVLGLAPQRVPQTHNKATATALRALAAAGEPARITLRQLVALEGVRWPRGVVRVCENPIVLAMAADRLRAQAPPLVCAAGVPNQALRVLLGQLVKTGAELCYHGDFDWPGLRIANGLFRDFPMKPWRFTAVDYGEALCHAGETWPLAGEPVAASWDERLAPSMVSGGRAIEEEAVVEWLVEDLRG